MLQWNPTLVEKADVRMGQPAAGIQSPEGVSDSEGIAVSLKRYPDTNPLHETIYRKPSSSTARWK